MNKTLQVFIVITVLLVLIIGSSFISQRIVNSSSEKLIDYINKIENSTENEDWDTATKLISETEKEWDDTQKSWAMLIEHIEIDQVNSSMARMKRLIDYHEKSMALTEISVLRTTIEQIPDRLAFTIQNIF